MNNYIHIPFCNQKCSYCKFALTPIFNDYKKKKYLKYLENEIIEKIKKYKVNKIDTIYFGGGTPSILTLGEVKEILSLFPFDQKTEISFESNPEDLNEKYIKGLLSLGVNRLSIGIQTLNNDSLELIGRKDKKYIINSLESLKNILVGNVGFFGNNNFGINIDLILGLPKVKYGETYGNIKYLIEKYSFINHISVYFLEKGLYPKSWNELSIDEEKTIKEFQKICELLNKKGFNHYEISNFCKNGKECRHNLGYWNHKNCLGFGLSASELIFDKGSYIRNTNSIGFSNYYKGKLEFTEELDQEQLEIEKLLFGIRTSGYKINEKKQITNKEKIKNYLDEKILEGNDKNFKISEKNIHMVDFVVEDILL